MYDKVHSSSLKKAINAPFTSLPNDCCLHYSLSVCDRSRDRPSPINILMSVSLCDKLGIIELDVIGNAKMLRRPNYGALQCIVHMVGFRHIIRIRVVEPLFLEYWDIHFVRPRGWRNVKNIRILT